MSDFKAVMANVSGELEKPASFSVTSTGSTTARSLANRFADVVNVKDFGAVGDAKSIETGSISSGNNTLTVGSASFSASDVGKQIVIEYAGSNKNSLFTTIASFTSSTQVTLAANAATTVSNKRVTWGTDDSDAIRAAAAYALNRTTLYFPDAVYLVTKLHNGNTQTNLATAGQGGSVIRYFNSTSTPQTFNIFGDNATLLMPIYPTTDGSQIGFVQFISVEGRFDNCTVDGLQFRSTHPLVESRVRGEAGYFTIGGINAIYLFWDAFNPSVSVNLANQNIPHNFIVRNCRFYDIAHAVNAWAARGLTIKNNVILVEYGYASTGNGDQVNQSITPRYAVSDFILDGNYYCGMTANDVSSIIMAPSSFGGQVASQDGLLKALGSQNVQIINNFVSRFSFEALDSGAGESANYNGRSKTIISNNYVVNDLPVGHPVVPSGAAISVDYNSFQITNNYLRNCTTGILTFASVVNNSSLISGNYIILPPYNATYYNGSFGIKLQSANNCVVSDNFIVGYDIGSKNQQGWDGNTFDAPIGGRSPLDITTGIFLTGSTTGLSDLSKVYIKNNTLQIVSKTNLQTSPAPVSAAFYLGANNGNFYIENNIVKGFDFAVERYGGNILNPHFKNLTFEGGKRLVAGYSFNSLSKFYNQKYKIYPTQTGWYRFLSEFGRRVARGKITIDISGETLYGDTTVADATNGYQKTEVEFSFFHDPSNTDSSFALNQISHAGGDSPAVNKIYLRSNSGSPDLYLNVDRIATKLALTFSGGGGSGAAGYANVSGGVVQTVTMTNNGGVANGGTDYTSAPTVSIQNQNALFLSGSGVSFTAVLSGGTVQSVTVNNGGSGYAHPITVTMELPENDERDYSAYDLQYTASTPSSGLELAFSNGAKNIKLTGGGSGVKTGSGDPILASTAPASTPEFIGQQYIDTSTGVAYLAAGTSSSADWKAISFWEP
jgi:hypothetical protein